jgi:acetate kinase
MKILVVNCGSSSLKFQLIDIEREHVLSKGLAERIGVIGKEGAALTYQNDGQEKKKIVADMPDHNVAFSYVLSASTEPGTGAISDLSEISAVGHRVVHGGEKFSESVLVTDEVIEAISEYSALAPLHNPPNLIGIHASKKAMPGVPQVVVFDTAFHQTMPKYAYLYALPYRYYTEQAVRRYGFHGTSHKYVSQRATAILEAQGIPAKDQKIITIHLGNGCSMTAVKGGKSVDTSMGFTPLEGLVMGTRCGDIDPALVPFLMKTYGLDTSGIDRMMNKESGLLGISGVGSDMRDIEATSAAGNERAKLALDIFCYRARKYVGAYAAAMGGVDAIVFTAGIGENSPTVRALTCQGLEYMGAELDSSKNEAQARGERVISTDSSKVKILVVPTNEELMIARETAEIVGKDTGRKDEGEHLGAN